MLTGLSGSYDLLECWPPAADLDELNANFVVKLKLIATYHDGRLINMGGLDFESRAATRKRTVERTDRMNQQDLSALLASEIAEIFEETFESVQGIYLDRGTSLFETLATISAEEASRPVSDTCSSIAGQVEHVRVYIEVIERYMRGEAVEAIDWDATWKLQTVAPEEWSALIESLQSAYRSVRDLTASFTDWHGENELAGALGILVHTAYHLGEIRHALCTIRD